MKTEKILIVDDNQSNLKFIKMFLNNGNYKISEANNGIQAWKILENEAVDLIITDLMMPVMDGYSLCKKVKKNEDTKNIPIIVVTALSEMEDKVKAFDAGADEFISKPFSSVELITRVKYLLRERRYYKQIIKQNKIYEKELNIAKTVQQSILPKEVPVSDKVKFASKYIPAYSIGGDYYCFKELNRNKIGIFISDVMGHGVISSLVTMLLKSHFDNLEQYYNKPSKLLKNLNTKIYDSISESMIYSTGVYCILDTNKLELHYSFAGHPPIYVISKDGDITSLKSSGGVIGLFDNMTYEENKYKLNSGDTVILYTDGVTEVNDESGKEFGESKFFEEIEKAPKFDTPEQMMDHLLNTVKEYSGKNDFNDDINLIIFKCS